jgi:hypothetical protein
MTRPALLLPREHGAYAELAFPLLTGLLCAPPTAATVAFAIAAVAAFLAHEPLAVMTGTRGPRLGAARERVAPRQFGWLIAVGILAGISGLVTGTPAARLAALVPVAALVVLAPWIVFGRLKMLSAELIAVAAFSATVLPVSVASGRSWAFGWTAAWVWLVSLSLGTLAVHALKARHKRVPRASLATTLTVMLAVAVVGAGAMVAARGWTSWLGVLAVGPPAALTVVLGVTAIHPRRLKRVGWSLVAANTVSLVCLLAM